MKFEHPPVLGVVGRASGSRQSDSHRRQHIVDTDLMEEKASQEFTTPQPSFSESTAFKPRGITALNWTLKRDVNLKLQSFCHIWNVGK